VITDRLVRIQAALAAAVVFSGVGAALASAGSQSLPLASGTVLRLIQQSATRLDQYPSIHEDMTISVHGQGHSATSHLVGDGTTDGRAGVLHLRLPGGAALQLVVAGRTVYGPVTSDELTFAGGKHWASLTVPASTTSVPTLREGLAFLRLLPGAVMPIRVVGHDKIDGVRTTHYRLKIDVIKAYAAVPPALRTTTVEQIQAVGIRYLTDNIWMDGDGFPRQITSTFSSHGISFALKMRLRGSPATVSVPLPASTDVYVCDNAQLFNTLVVPLPRP